MSLEVRPLVSILTPTYNRADYLVETLESVLGQTYPNIEYIVLDDGSTDNSREILERYADRLTWESHANRGETRTVNKGWGMTHGDYIMVVNSDDPIRLTTVEKMVAFMEARPDLLVAYPYWHVIDNQSQVIAEDMTYEYDYADMLTTCACFPGPGALLRRRGLELVPARDTKYRYVADYEYWLRLGLYGPFARVPEYLATHRVHSDSAGVKANPKIARELIQLMTEFFQRPNLPPEIRALRRKALSAAYNDAGERVLPIHYLLGLRYLAYALLLVPRRKSSTARQVSFERALYLLNVYLPPRYAPVRPLLNPRRTFQSLEHWTTTKFSPFRGAFLRKR